MIANARNSALARRHNTDITAPLPAAIDRRDNYQRWVIATVNLPSCRLHLLHLPCHQSLDDRELEWMIAAIQKVGADRSARG